MINEERERAVATDVRSRVIADCAALLPLARSACKAMDEGVETEVLRLFCGESQKQTLRRLGRLIDDLSLCRTVADLPGPEPEVVELRNASFRVFRGLSVRAGNPLNLAKRFRAGARATASAAIAWRGRRRKSSSRFSAHGRRMATAGSGRTTATTTTSGSSSRRPINAPRSIVRESSRTPSPRFSGGSPAPTGRRFDV